MLKMKDRRESALALFAPMWVTGNEERLGIKIYNVGKTTARQMLSDHWGTTTREGLIEQIHRMSNAEGHSLEYMEYHNLLLEMPEEKIAAYIDRITDESLREQFIIINTYKYDLRKCGGQAFDICRGQFLASIGYEAGYLSESEAWDFILKTYDKYCNHFDSWDQYMLSYGAGRQYWSANTSDGYAREEIIYRNKRLFIDDKSLFRK